jgi:hypothetical protein
MNETTKQPNANPLKIQKVNNIRITACVKPPRSAPHLTPRRRPDLMTNVDRKYCPQSSDRCPASVGPLSGLHRAAVRNQSISLSAFAKMRNNEFCDE